MGSSGENLSDAPCKEKSASLIPNSTLSTRFIKPFYFLAVYRHLKF